MNTKTKRLKLENKIIGNCLNCKEKVKTKDAIIPYDNKIICIHCMYLYGLFRKLINFINSRLWILS